MQTANIKEIFTSIQGEGPYIGFKQLFIRFCGCNLSCSYCDTDFDSKNSKTYSSAELINIVNNCTECHSISLTGGEPLLYYEFLQDFLPYCKLPVYLETNATLPKELEKIIDYVDYIAADIKLPSATNISPLWNEHDIFFEIAAKKNLFAKIVFNQNITDDEITKSINLASKYNAEIILQPMFSGTNILPETVFIEKTFDKFLKIYKKVRVIPQVHKFMNVR